MELSELPSELILVYALKLDLPSLSHLCNTNKEFNKQICQNEHFWKLRFIQDYKFTPSFTPRSWKDLYRNYKSVWSFGFNHSGQLGLGDTESRNTPTMIPDFKVKAVAAGLNHTLFLDLNDKVWFTGQFLVPNWTSPVLIFDSPVKSISPYGIVDAEGNIWVKPRGIPGNKLIPPSNPVDFKAKSIAAGGWHTLIIDEDDNVWAMGSNGNGQLGLGDFGLRLDPTMIPNLKASAISVGTSHSVIIDLEGNVLTFGYNGAGQLGLGDNQDRSTPTPIGFKAKSISAGGSFTVFIDLDDNLWSFGRNATGQLGLGDTMERLHPNQVPGFKAKSVSAGKSHTLAIDFEDSLWTFGNNTSGELGVRNGRVKLTPTLVSWLKVNSVSAGGDHSVVIGTLITS